ncbi:MAG: tetratricopeptide repeat protein [Alloprevotella sp.]|nr:tetratricopeptide repeat protein [Alloprevotella sp.]
MDLVHYIDHPEQLGKESLYQLRQVVAQHPYYHAARLLFLQNLFLLRDPSFGEELRRAALYLPDRRVLYEMVEAPVASTLPGQAALPAQPQDTARPASRTQTLIDDFLNTLPPEEMPTARQATADSASDYTAVLMGLSDVATDGESAAQAAAQPKAETSRQHRRQLLDSFIENSEEHIELQEKPEYLPELPDEKREDDADEEFFTETLARIYTKQGRYDKAAQIIRRIYLNNPKKSAYFADQLRFLEKLKLVETYNNKQKINKKQ